ncbi:MAG: 30S ribosomal protein S6 [Vulcanimicrobiaceae bacterium]
MNDYEVTYILRPALEESDVEAYSARVAEIVTGQGGEIVAIEKLGKKRLAYAIADVREGSYVAMHFRGEPAVAKELERQLKLQEDVLRELLVSLDKQALAAMKAAQAAAPPPAAAPL